MHVIEFARWWKVGVTSVVVRLTTLIGSIAAAGVCLLGVVEHLGIVEAVLIISVVVPHWISCTATIVRLHLSRVTTSFIILCTCCDTSIRIWVIIVENSSLLLRIVASTLVHSARTVVDIRIITLSLVSSFVASLTIYVQLTSVLLDPRLLNFGILKWRRVKIITRLIAGTGVLMVGSGLSSLVLIVLVVLVIKLVILSSETTIVLAMRSSLIIATSSASSSILVLTWRLTWNLEVHIIISVALSLIILPTRRHFLPHIWAILVANTVILHWLQHLLTCIMLWLLLLAPKRVILTLLLKIMTLYIILPSSKALVPTLFIKIASTLWWSKSLLVIILVCSVVLFLEIVSGLCFEIIFLWVSTVYLVFTHLDPDVSRSIEIKI